MDVVTSRDRADLEKEAGEAFRERWPEFIFHDDVPKQYMPRVADYFRDYDILLLEDGKVAAGGWGVPLAWDGTVEDLPKGYDDALVRPVEGHERSARPNTVSFMAVVPDVLNLLHGDRESDTATYREENLWVQHR